ncbi:pol polyprotein [Tanacetum coccineum]
MAIDTNVTAPVTVTGAPVTNTVANHAENLKKFNGQNFKRWQLKMFFYLTTLNLARFLNEIAPQVEPPTKGQPSNAQAVQAVEAWKHSDFLCHNYILNGLVDSLYNVYCKTTTAKELWESLERKYKTEDAGTKKFVVLLHEIHAEGMTVSEAFQVAAIIEKLPPSWLAQKNTYTPDSAKANMVEHVGSSSKSNSKAKGKGKKKNDKKGKRKAEYLAPKAGIVKRKFQGTCYNCDQPSHHAVNCKMPKRVNPRQANTMNDNMDMIAMVSDVISMISEVNLVGSNNCSWWIDTRATRHVCADKSMFHSFRAVDNGEKLYMGNSETADIKGEGDVILKMTSEKEIKLTNVLYVLEIRKNFMSGWLLNKFGFRLVFKSGKFVLSKNQIYVGMGYALNGMFKLNVMVVMNNINKMNYSAYLIESSNVCKNEAIDKFGLYKTEVENQLGRKIKVVRSDRGGEYVSPFIELCAKHGIRYEFTAPYSPQQNGEAIITATYLLNKIPCKEKEETPYELWMGRKPSYQYLRVWGCLATVAVPTPKAQKIGPKSVDCIFIGYAKNSSAYRFIVHDSKNPDIQKDAVIESRNASFFENIFPCLLKETGSSYRLDGEVFQDKRQRDDNDLHDERQDQLE